MRIRLTTHPQRRMCVCMHTCRRAHSCAPMRIFYSKQMLTSAIAVKAINICLEVFACGYVWFATTAVIVWSVPYLFQHRCKFCDVTDSKIFMHYEFMSNVIVYCVCDVFWFRITTGLRLSCFGWFCLLLHHSVMTIGLLIQFCCNYVTIRFSWAITVLCWVFVYCSWCVSACNHYSSSSIVIVFPLCCFLAVNLAKQAPFAMWNTYVIFLQFCPSPGVHSPRQRAAFQIFTTRVRYAMGFPLPCPNACLNHWPQWTPNEKRVLVALAYRPSSKV